MEQVKQLLEKISSMILRQQPRISVGLGRKINTGNYESVDFHASISRDLESGETVEDALVKETDRLNEFARIREMSIREKLRD